MCVWTAPFGCAAEAIRCAARSSRSPKARLAAKRAFSMKEESSRKAQRSTKGWLATSKDLRVRRVEFRLINCS